MSEIDLRTIGPKWQRRWAEEEIFRAEEDPAREKFYCLEMYPYPSASSLHMGHVRNYAIGDALARYMRMRGRNVLYPMGYDAFGLPAENAAKKEGIHPAEYTAKSIAIIKRQQQALGLSYDWSRQLASCDEDYYKWNQWFFLKLFKAGLAVRREAPVNWCPKCESVLANEQVHDGRCWRHDDTEVEIRSLNQWFLRITAYADRLLRDLDKLHGWPERIRTMQRNWIGRSEGTKILFPIEGSNETVPIFTTRIDTIYGVTFMVFAPEHPLIERLVRGSEHEQAVRAFAKKVVLEDRHQRTADDAPKEGLFTGRYATNPLTGERIPIYVGNFVLLEYGAGAVMAVPAHDQRDFAFAKEHGLPLKVVINPDSFDLDPATMSRAYTADGTLTNSGPFDGLPNRDAIEAITKHLKTKGLGEASVEYKLRDWLISRQRYWGTPIPIIICERCNEVAVPQEQLPVRLPEQIDLNAQGNPLAHEAFTATTCPRCGAPARRESDTMDGFIDSCWYFLGYTTRDRSKQPFDRSKAQYWMPVDQYIGGAEHAVMHLLYARFFTKILHEMGMVEFDEPFTRLFNQGILYKDGAKMSKSKGNVVTQDAIAERYGIDTARHYLLQIASPEKTVEWDDAGVIGSYKTLQRIARLAERERGDEEDAASASQRNRTIKAVSEHLEGFRFNLALIEITALARQLERLDPIPRTGLKTLAQLLAPFCPHLAEELWERIGEEGFASVATWPQADEGAIDERLEARIALIDAIIEDVRNVQQLAKIERPEQVRIITAQAWRYAFIEELKAQMERESDPGTIIKALMQGGLREHGKQIAKLVPALLNHRAKIPQTMLSAEEELEALRAARERLQEEIGCAIEIETAQASREAKAAQAMPGKPAIIIYS